MANDYFDRRERYSRPSDADPFAKIFETFGHSDIQTARRFSARMLVNLWD
jgi:hypothetical protein